MRNFSLGIAFTILLLGCAGVSFPYKFYNPQFVSFDGTLLGPKPADDLPGAACAPSPGVKNPCIIMMATEFFSMKAEYEDMQNRLNQCEAPPNP